MGNITKHNTECKVSPSEKEEAAICSQKRSQSPLLSSSPLSSIITAGSSPIQHTPRNSGGITGFYYIKKNKKQIDDFVQVLFPVYYVDEIITVGDIASASVSWNLIVNNTAPGYMLSTTHHMNAISYFFDIFYTRFFDIYPAAKTRFKSGIRSQGKHLCCMISSALTTITDDDKIKENMIYLTEVHHKRGVRTIEYGIMGDVLFWSMKKICGDEVYNVATHRAWVKIMSKLLKYIIPHALSLEMQQIHQNNYESIKI
jgi:hemoglobin-like flavoprotein